MDPDDLPGIFSGYIFDINPADITGHDQRHPGGIIDKHCQIHFPGYIYLLLDQHALNFFAMNHRGEESLRFFPGAFRIIGKADAADLAPSFHIELGFKDHGPAQPPGGFLSFPGRCGQDAFWCNDPKFSENLLGLKFFQLHG